MLAFAVLAASALHPGGGARPAALRFPATPRSVVFHASASLEPPAVTRAGLAGSLKHIHGLAAGRSWARAVPCNDLDECLALCDEEECVVIMPTSLVQRLKVGFYFGLWFLLSVGYSVTNKKVTNSLPLPWSVATGTVLVGSVFVGVLWATGLREPPHLSLPALWTLLPIGAFHAVGHLAGTIGTAAGPVSFAQVVKAAGPVYACVLSALVLGKGVSRRAAASLVPIMAGVALATVKELSFSWAALTGAVVSDVALALRNICSKLSMDKPKGKNMTPANLFGVLTVLSTVVSLPLAFVAERQVAPVAWATATAVTPAPRLIWQICLTGLYFYGYSEVAMQALSNVHPVTHAIGNTLRRVVIMVVTAIVFATPMTPLGITGAACAIFGSYLYSVAKHADKAQADATAEAAKATGLAARPWVPSTNVAGAGAVVEAVAEEVEVASTWSQNLTVTGVRSVQ